jgi:hypothetical protein
MATIGLAFLLFLAGIEIEFGIAAAVYAFVRGAERSGAVMRELSRLQDTTAQIRVRAACSASSSKRWALGSSSQFSSSRPV